MSRFVDTLVATAAGRGQQRGMVTGEPKEPVRRTWAEIHEQAKRVAGGLVAGGLEPGKAVAVLAAAPSLIAPTVQAVWLAGGSVTMLHQPTQRTDLAEWAEDTVRVLRMIGSGLVLLGEPFDQLAPVLTEHGIAFQVITELLAAEPLAEPVPTAESDTALLQLTSGSTADPKAVQITYGNLYSNVKAMVDRAEFDFDVDVMVSWLPTFHDMGMVGFLTVPMTFGVELVKITPLEFLSGPLIWPQLISKYNGTTTAAPNFAYAIVGRRMARVDDDDAYDLSKLRIALNGAEPIDETAVQTFVEAGARFKMPAECVFPAYGMAEATLAVSFAPLFTGLTLDVVEADALETDNRAVPVPEGDPRRGTDAVRSFAILGPPLDGLEAEIVDDKGTVLGERQVGEIRLRGEAVTPGYLTMDGPLATQDENGWLLTGDLGYLVDGMIVICGRRKDVIIMGGRNLYPTDIERAATSVEGVRAGNAVAVRIDAGSRRERFAVVVESKLAGDPGTEKALAKEVAARVRDAVDMRPFAVVVLPAGSLPKTPSGKVKRAATATQFADKIAKNAATT
ncbi:fatty acyl-AMP ligase [Amycolatopsis regifaucium]|uniref:Long-chain fatty acid--CoA ligase n=1 Tax=Amycolatopsis regifaucium TaxID=546365 RepID=A0A154MUT9_9PSEU|nr:fatty acyl-AMP ligase [Amycolatopsis regifaucium]KZB87507.1 long-chain fatty acid--CoA ligase [Amycolatopsis regifaucium]OKA08340.1 long-chain fatty acid--CoA ligase [Amycolatopsis regifaucium]SFI07514.1 fatty-acyl-CoA synthase [Amycolatopsis regifaucium]